MDVGQKSLTRRVDPLVVVMLLPLAEFPLLAIYSSLAGPFVFPAVACIPLFGSAMLNSIGMVCFMRSLHRSPISLTIPLLSLTPVLTTLFGWVFRNQLPGPSQMFGAVLVVVGAFFLGSGSSGGRGFGGFLREPGVPLMIGAATAWSCTALLDQTAMAYGAGVWYAPALALSMGICLNAFFLATGKGLLLRQGIASLAARPGLGIVVGLMGAVVLAFQIEAVRLVPAGFNETVRRGLGMASAIVSGRIFFQESITSRKVVAVVILTLGVALVVGVR